MSRFRHLIPLVSGLFLAAWLSACGGGGGGGAGAPSPFTPDPLVKPDARNLMALSFDEAATDENTVVLDLTLGNLDPTFDPATDAAALSVDLVYDTGLLTFQAFEADPALDDATIAQATPDDPSRVIITLVGPVAGHLGKLHFTRTGAGPMPFRFELAAFISPSGAILAHRPVSPRGGALEL